MGAGASAMLNAETSMVDTEKLQVLAREKFDELDVDKSNFLENAELIKVAEWVVSSFGDNVTTTLEDAKGRMLQRLDTNKDGKLDFSEFINLFTLMTARFALIERAKGKFIELDADSSGFLEGPEIDKCVSWALEAYQGEDPATYKTALMNKVDANKDGKIDLMEFTMLFEDMLARLELITAAKKKFDELDVDKSGFLETPEISTLMTQVLSAYVEKSPEEREKFQVTLLDRIDQNKDGKLDLSEFTKLWEEMMARLDLIEHARKKFNTLDTDKSGFLEKPELTVVLMEWAATCKAATAIDVDAACTELIASVDVNGDGKLDLLEFVVIFETTMAKVGVWGKTAEAA